MNKRLLVVSMIAVLGLNAHAVDPVPTTPTQEKMQEAQTTGGALKVQKKPAEMESLPAAPKTKVPKKKKK